MWNEEFHFILEEPPSQDKIQIKVMSKRTVVGFKSKVPQEYSMLIYCF